MAHSLRALEALVDILVDVRISFMCEFENKEIIFY